MVDLPDAAFLANLEARTRDIARTARKDSDPLFLSAEADVRTAGLAAGLVDVKVVSFDETRTAEKLVIPVSQR